MNPGVGFNQKEMKKNERGKFFLMETSIFERDAVILLFLGAILENLDQKFSCGNSRIFFDEK